MLLHCFWQLNTRILKNPDFLFIGILVCLVFIGFYSRFSHGGQYVSTDGAPKEKDVFLFYEK